MATKFDRTGMPVSLLDKPSKADEIEIVQSMVAYFAGTDTYLSSLFTNEFASWVGNNIRNDIVPDIYGELTAAYNNLSAAASATHKEKQTAEENQRRATIAAERAETQRAALQATIDRLVEADEERRNRYIATITDYQDCERTFADVIAEQRSTIEKQTAEITALKALLWDYSQELKNLGGAK